MGGALPEFTALMETFATTVLQPSAVVGLAVAGGLSLIDSQDPGRPRS